MDNQGFYPRGTKCRVCGAVLGGNFDGSGYDRPAELYAGTFTGLCYQCEKAPRFIMRIEWDEARTISYPPHSPAWRRDRQEYIAYADCQECHGAGRFIVDRADSQGGSYPRYCPACLDRYCAESHRKHWSDLLGAVRLENYNQRFLKELCRYMRVRTWRKLPLFPWTEQQTKDYQTMVAVYRDMFAADLQAVQARINRERAELMAATKGGDQAIMPIPFGRTKKAAIEDWLEKDPESRGWFKLAWVAETFKVTAGHVRAIIAELNVNNWTIERSERIRGRNSKWRVVQTAREKARSTL
jgi:hypothetical protein